MPHFEHFPFPGEIGPYTQLYMYNTKNEISTSMGDKKLRQQQFLLASVLILWSIYWRALQKHATTSSSGQISWICQSLVCLATIGGQRLPNSIKSVTNQCTLFVFHRSGYNQILKNGTKNDCFAFNCWPSKGITTKSRFWDEHHNKYNLLVAPR